MGQWKKYMMQQEDQGWTFSDAMICWRCLSDPHLRDVARKAAKGNECDFCQRSSKRPTAAPFNDVMRVIAATLFQYFVHASRDVIAYDSEDGSWVGDTYDTHD